MDSAADSLLALSNTAAAIAAQDDPPSDDDRSSSLSELDENLDEDSDGLDSDPIVAIDADSEAETERLQITPENLARKKPFEISPSKLAHRQDVDMRPEIESLTESSITSPISSHADSDIDGILSDPPEVEEDHDPEPQAEPEVKQPTSPNKRKRDESESEAEEAPRSQRRRTGSVDTEHEKSEPESDAEDSRSQPSREATVEPEPGLEVAEPDEDEVEEEPGEEQKEPGKADSSEDSKGKTRSRTRRKAKGDTAEEPQADGEEDEPEAAEDSEAEDNDVDTTAKSEEEHANRMAAMEALMSLEKHFAALRDRLYDERIAGINHELNLLAASQPSHPEFIRQVEAVHKYRDEKFEVEQKLLVYKVGALKNKSVAERSQIHSQFFQTVRDIRERHLERLSEHFYRIQRDRFKSDSAPNYTIAFPERRSQQILQQTAYNKEVSILSGVAKYVGFPAAPELAPAKQKDSDEDMQKMGISPALPRSARPTQRPAPTSGSAQISGPQAEEQFLEQTPWANPQHPIHRLAISRQNSNRSPLNNDVFLTPASQQHTTDSLQPTGSASTIVDPSAQHSSVANTPHDGQSSATKMEHQSNSNNIHNYRLHTASPLDTRRPNPNSLHPNSSIQDHVGENQPQSKDAIRDIASSPLNARANLNMVNSPPRVNSTRPEKGGRLGHNDSPFRKDTAITAGIGSTGVNMGMGRFSIR